MRNKIYMVSTYISLLLHLFLHQNKALALLPQSAGQAVKDALTASIDYVIERDK